MKRLKAFRVRIYPTPEQEVAFARIAGCCRLVYNLGLEQRSSFWRQHRANTGRTISWISQKRELSALKAEAPFLAEAPAHCLQSALADLDRAYGNFFAGHASYPRPRKRFDHDSFTFPEPNQIRIDRSAGLLVLPKFGKTGKDAGPLRVILHRPIPGRVRRVTISRDGAHWYASILTRTDLRAGKARPVEHAPIGAEDVIALDRGTVEPIATSDGRFFGREIEAESQRRKTRRLQKDLSRTQRGSNRRRKALKRLRTHKARLTRRRRDVLHKISSDLVRNFRAVVLEDLRIRNMTGSARGTLDAPGRNVAQKAGLNRAILDKGWGELDRQLAYKLAWAGGRLIKVDPRNTSRTCGCCGHIDAQSRISRDRFLCRSCGYEEHADTNAAHEILRRGLVDLGLPLPPRQELSWQPAEPSAPARPKREKKNDGISRWMRQGHALELNA